MAISLREGSANVIVHDEVFKPTALDAEWLERAGRECWVVLTKDQRIRYNTLEITALLRSGARVFVLVSGNLTGPEIVEVFTRALPKIRRLAISTRAPFIAKVFRNGSVSIWMR